MDARGVNRPIIVIILSLAAMAAAGAESSSSLLSDTGSERLEISGFYKNLYSITDVRDNFLKTGVADSGLALNDLQRLRLKCRFMSPRHIQALLHYEVRAAYGELTDIGQKLNDSVSAPAAIRPDTAERIRFFDLEKTVVDDNDLRLTHDLDRLQLRVRSERTDITVGRQPVSWGSGLIWTPTDLFTGFSPTEIDRDEKAGVDVIRVTWSPRPEATVDVVAEPLDDDGPWRLSARESSLAVRTQIHVGEYEVAPVFGYIGGDWVAGGDFTGYLGNAGLRGECLVTTVDESDQRDYMRALLSLDYGFPGRWAPYAAIEYFYNGLGAGRDADYLRRRSESSVRRAFLRGNAFNLGRHYIGLINRFTPTALVSMQFTTLWNVADGSVQEFVSLQYSISDNIDFLIGATIGIGDVGSEFGGFSTAQAGIDFRSPDLYFAFLKCYF